MHSARSSTRQSSVIIALPQHSPGWLGGGYHRIGPRTTPFGRWQKRGSGRSEEHTSELQSLMRISYAVFCLTKKKTQYEMSQSHSETASTQAKTATTMPNSISNMNTKLTSRSPNVHVKTTY